MNTSNLVNVLLTVWLFVFRATTTIRIAASILPSSRAAQAAIQPTVPAASRPPPQKPCPGQGYRPGHGHGNENGNGPGHGHGGYGQCPPPNNCHRPGPDHGHGSSCNCDCNNGHSHGHSHGGGGLLNRFRRH
ncbi:hypothetical protein FB639_000160 [Coemansia asiatica]|nr:hypothetical protein FB639_000160 [Coemansia asiatica]